MAEENTERPAYELEDEEKLKVKTLITTKFFKNFDDMDLGIVQVTNDRIPSVLQVRDLDIICFVFAMITYCLDMYTDVLTAVFHLINGRYIACCVIFGITVFSSIILNITSRYWMLYKESQYHPSRSRRLLCCHFDKDKVVTYGTMRVFLIFQIGPVYWLYKSLFFGLQFRKTEGPIERKRYYFKKMVEAERDASILRIIEAFIESAPQLVVQGIIAYNFIFFDESRKDIPLFFWFQCFSMFVSIISLSWAIIVQNRSFRMVRDDKLNLWPREVILMFLWRFFTIFSRIWVIVIVTVSKDAVVFYVIHFAASLMHVISFQSVEMKTRNQEYATSVVTTFIHFFVPMNIAEGPTRWRYAFAYLIEFFEMIYALKTMSWEGSENVHQIPISIVVIASFFIGIAFMVVYYNWYHPNIRHAQREERKRQRQQAEPEEIELTEFSLACEAMRLASNVINVINE